MIKTWIKAARLRTLPLAASGILCGGALAWYDDAFCWLTSSLALLTALLLQILSNFANDYGDYTKGTDNDERVGPERALQSGDITTRGMKNAMIITAILSLLSGILLVVHAVPMLTAYAWLAFLVLGLLAIGAAVMYTVGQRAYGYRGLGDVMVFIFFGLASVLGTYYLNAGTLTLQSLLMAICLGLLSTGVLNLNNMRDIDNDRASGKLTLAVKLGFINAKRYHALIILMAIACLIVTCATLPLGSWLYALLALPVFMLTKDLSTIIKTIEKATLDPFLKKLALGTFVLIMAFVATLIINHYR